MSHMSRQMKYAATCVRIKRCSPAAAVRVLKADNCRAVVSGGRRSEVQDRTYRDGQQQANDSEERDT